MVEKRILLVLIGGEHAGDLRQNEHGQIDFSYTDRWVSRREATPLSLSLPLAAGQHRSKAVMAYLRGLLPDSEAVLVRWGSRFGVSHNNPFALLGHVGEDVAGAVQFVKESRLEEATAPGAVDYVDESYVESRLKALKTDRAAWTDTRGRFSLGGAQSKFALYRSQDGRWGVPSGRSATTHIFKPALPDLAEQEINEHLCLQAAAKLGMETSRSEVSIFGDEPSIVLQRYDRMVGAGGEVVRIHQEDMCQALGVPPEKKYQREDGGPGAGAIVNLLRSHQSPAQAQSSTETIFRSLAFNWVIYGPDAHAKNFSVMLAGAQVRLAPLYDISSIAPYLEQYDLSRVAMAMSVNNKYRNSTINREDWEASASALGVDPDMAVSWVAEVVARAPDAFVDVARSSPRFVGRAPIAGALVDAVASASEMCLRFLGEVATGTRQRAIRGGGDPPSAPRCRVCNRPLKQPASIARGAGPACATRTGAE